MKNGQMNVSLMETAVFKKDKEVTDPVTFVAGLTLKEGVKPQAVVQETSSPCVPAMAIKTIVPAVEVSTIAEAAQPTHNTTPAPALPPHNKVPVQPRKSSFGKIIRQFEAKDKELEATVNTYLAMLLLVQTKPSAKGREQLKAAFDFWNEHAKQREFTPAQYRSLKDSLFKTRDILNQNRDQAKLKWNQEMNAAKALVASIPTFKRLSDYRGYVSTEVKHLIGKSFRRRVYEMVVEPQLLRIERALISAMAA